MADFAGCRELLRVSGIIKESVVDGPGIRLVVFTQGCDHRCPGCHNPETHAPDGGYLITLEEIFETVKSNQLLRGLTFSGGEPFSHALKLSYLAGAVNAIGLDVVTYTGYTLEEIIEISNAKTDADYGVGFRELLAETWLLIDGPFIESKRTLEKPFVGSTNQRIIDVAPTLETLRVSGGRPFEATIYNPKTL